MVNKYNEQYTTKIRSLINIQSQKEDVTYLNQAFNVLLRLELVEFFDKYTPSEDSGYIFDNFEIINKIYIEVDKESGGNHSGCSMGLTMRILKNIMTNA